MTVDSSTAAGDVDDMKHFGKSGLRMEIAINGSDGVHGNPFDSLEEAIRSLALVDISSNDEEAKGQQLMAGSLFQQNKAEFIGRRESKSSDLTESDADKYSGLGDDDELEADVSIISDVNESEPEADDLSVVPCAFLDNGEASNDENDEDPSSDDDDGDDEVEGANPGRSKAPNYAKPARTMMNDVHHHTSPYARPNARNRFGHCTQQILNDGSFLQPSHTGCLPQLGFQDEQVNLLHSGFQQRPQPQGYPAIQQSYSSMLGNERLHLQVQPTSATAPQGNFAQQGNHHQQQQQQQHQEAGNWLLDGPESDFLNQLMLSVVGSASELEDLNNLQGQSLADDDGAFFANDFSLPNEQHQQQQSQHMRPSNVQDTLDNSPTCHGQRGAHFTMNKLQPEMSTMIVPSGTPSPFYIFSPASANSVTAPESPLLAQQDGGFSSSSSGFDDTCFLQEKSGREVNRVHQPQQYHHGQNYQQMPPTPAFSDQSETSNGVYSPYHQQYSPQSSQGSISPTHLQAVPELPGNVSDILYTNNKTMGQANTIQSSPADEPYRVPINTRDTSPSEVTSARASSRGLTSDTVSGQQQGPLPYLTITHHRDGAVTGFIQQRDQVISGTMASSQIQPMSSPNSKQQPAKRPVTASLPTYQQSLQAMQRQTAMGERKPYVRDPSETAILEFTQCLNPSLRRAMMIEIFSLPISKIVQPSPGDNISMILAALRDRTQKKPRLEHIFALVMRLKAEQQLDILNRPTYLNTKQLDSCYTYLHIFILESVKFAISQAPHRPSFHPRVLEDDVKIFKFLLGCGANPYLKYNSSGDTLIHFMARLGDLTTPFLREIVHNPDVFDGDKVFSKNFEATGDWNQHGKTPLMVAREMDGQRSLLGHLVRTIEIQRLIMGRMATSLSS